jgi:hypothetical protein
MDIVFAMLVFAIFIALLTYSVADIKRTTFFSTRCKWNFCSLVFLLPVLGSLLYFIAKKHRREALKGL